MSAIRPTSVFKFASNNFGILIKILFNVAIKGTIDNELVLVMPWPQMIGKSLPWTKEGHFTLKICVTKSHGVDE